MGIIDSHNGDSLQDTGVPKCCLCRRVGQSMSHGCGHQDPKIRNVREEEICLACTICNDDRAMPSIVCILVVFELAAAITEMVGLARP